MKPSKNKVYSRSGYPDIDVCRVYKQGRSAKLWLNAEVSKSFLANYEFQRLLCVFDDNLGVLFLYKFKSKAEFEKIFKISSERRLFISKLIERNDTHEV